MYEKLTSKHAVIFRNIVAIAEVTLKLEMHVIGIN